MPFRAYMVVFLERNRVWKYMYHPGCYLVCNYGIQNWKENGCSKCRTHRVHPDRQRVMTVARFVFPNVTRICRSSPQYWRNLRETKAGRACWSEQRLAWELSSAHILGVSAAVGFAQAVLCCTALLGPLKESNKERKIRLRRVPLGCRASCLYSKFDFWAKIQSTCRFEIRFVGFRWYTRPNYRRAPTCPKYRLKRNPLTFFFFSGWCPILVPTLLSYSIWDFPK